MDGRLLSLAERLQERIGSLDPLRDRDTLVWAHGFLSSIIKNIESEVPDFITAATRHQSIREKLNSIRFDRPQDGEDAAEDAGVPATRKPGPKGLSGGAALSLPDSDLLT